MQSEGAYNTNSRNVRKMHTQSFKDNNDSDSMRRPFGSALRDSKNMIYQSAQRHQLHRGGTAIFQSVGRLSEDQAPHGSRSNHIYNSPHFKPSSSFNFWNDLTLNQTTRNKWEQQSATIDLNGPIERTGGGNDGNGMGLKSVASTSDLISLRVNNKIGGT
jgi:hypothetical protein